MSLARIPPSLRGSYLSSNWGRSLAHVNPPMSFATVQVRDIGLRSFSMAPGGHALGTGVTMEDLSRDGIYPSFNDWL